jgi:hypothetical protein
LEDGAGGTIGLTCRPATLGSGSAIVPDLVEDGLRARWETSFGGLTAFFVFQLTGRADAEKRDKSFAVAAELIGAPEDRMDRVLVSELRSRSDLVRLLLLLLGTLDPAYGDLVDLLADRAPAGWDRDPLLGSDALLEPLMRALARDPGRLDEIERLVDQLVRTEEGRQLLPDGWPELWSAVQAARAPVMVAP